MSRIAVQLILAYIE